MSQIADFTKFIIPFVHDCPEPAALIAARFALIEFCELTDWLQQELEPTNVQAGVADYDIETFEDTMAVRVLYASLDNVPLQAVTKEELNTSYTVDWRTLEGTPTRYTQITRDQLKLVPSPLEDVADGLKLIVSVAPTLDAKEVDDSLYNRYAEAIGYGARARLKEMPGQPYYDAAGAVACWQTFRTKATGARIERSKDMGNAVQHVQMRRF